MVALEAAFQTEHIVRVFGYWRGDAPPEKRAFLRSASIVMIAYIIGVFIIFLCL
jgi:hypothetical protein